MLAGGSSSAWDDARRRGCGVESVLVAEHLPAEVPGHAHHGRGLDAVHNWVSIAEAVLLSLVTIVAAWSGYSAAKWGTEASLQLASASATRTKANRAFQESLTLRNVDATMFNAWYSARVAGDANAMRVAAKRFRPAYAAAFDAWIATRPFTNPDAPRGPQQMPQYKMPGAALARRLDQEAEALYAHAEHDARTGDDYVRTTVILASVLFIVGIASQFSTRGIRLGLVGVGTAMLIFGAVLILRLPLPP
jgi:hypothetical protein